MWAVTTAAGHTWYLTGLQRAALLWLTSSSGYGRHDAKVIELARAIGCGPGTASKILRRLRSLSLIGARRPNRGRHGGFRYWRPSPGSVRRDHARRRTRWPTFANDSTPTPFGGYLTREGMRRSWRASADDRSGGPPVAAAPRRGASRSGPRARGRPWPPRYTDERCSRDGARVRLVRIADRGAPAGDLAATYGARCPRCRSPIAASAILVAPVSGPVLAGTVDVGIPTVPEPSSIAARPSPLAAAAAAVIPELRHAGQVDRLRVDHLGYRRRQLVIPPIRPAIAGGVDTPLQEVAAAAWSEAMADLAAVTASRELEAP